MAEILLTSEAFVKNTTSISDNVAGKYLLPSLREAQEMGLKSILGDVLLSKLKDLVRTNEINDTANAMYKSLLDKCQYYLAYATIIEVTTKVSYKVANSGVSRTTDENVQSASADEIDKLQYYYESKKDACCLDLQNFILDNRTAFPEVNNNQAHKIESNLYSSASCGIFLGGARGKGLIPRRYRRRGME